MRWNVFVVVFEVAHVEVRFAWNLRGSFGKFVCGLFKTYPNQNAHAQPLTASTTRAISWFRGTADFGNSKPMMCSIPNPTRN